MLIESLQISMHCDDFVKMVNWVSRYVSDHLRERDTHLLSLANLAQSEHMTQRPFKGSYLQKEPSLTRFLGSLGCVCVGPGVDSGLVLRWTAPPVARSGNSSSS